MDAWYTRHELETDRMVKFMLGWIVFNHIYSNYWDAIPGPNNRTERHEITHFAGNPVVADAFARSVQSWTSRTQVALPISDRNGNPVPQARNGTFRASQLTTDEYLQVCYQIRCGYVHGRNTVRGLTADIEAAFSSDSFRDFLTVLVRKLDTLPPQLR